MAGETMRFRNPAGHAGLLHNLVALLNSLAGFLESRLALFAAESKTALVHVLILVACLAGAAFLGLFGYLFLVASAIAGLAHAFQVSWIKITLGTAGFGFLLAVFFVFKSPRRVDKTIFVNKGTGFKKKTPLGQKTKKE